MKECSLQGSTAPKRIREKRTLTYRSKDNHITVTYPQKTAGKKQLNCKICKIVYLFILGERLYSSRVGQQNFYILDSPKERH